MIHSIERESVKSEFTGSVLIQNTPSYQGNAWKYGKGTAWVYILMRVENFGITINNAIMLAEI